MVRKTGETDLWLVSGGVPHFREMVELAGPIVTAIIDLSSRKEFIRRISNPCWFSSLSSALGWEWNTSGQTTVTLSALKVALMKENLGVKLAGGKWMKGRAVPDELNRVGEELGISSSKIEGAAYASKMAAKVDSAALHDLEGPIYCHYLIIEEKGAWSLIQQKMDAEKRKARRYHWLHGIESFVNEPHSGILGDKQPIVLDLTASESEDARKTITELVSDTEPKRLVGELERIRKGQLRLTDFFENKVKKTPYLLPGRMNIKALRHAKDTGVKDFEELLGIKGIGASTVRGLGYISALVYGTEPSWKDPARYQWVFGTKSGYPWHIQKNEMKKAAEVLKRAI